MMGAMVHLDHLLFGAHDLQRAVDALARTGTLTVRPGGRHTGYGTHNALAHLGGTRYLEAIAIDRTQDGGSFARAVAQLTRPSLFAWCARCDDPSDLLDRLRDRGLVAESATMSRTTPDGAELSWTLIVAHGHPFGGAAPFFIHWGATQHPTSKLVEEARLRSFVVRHPCADDLAALWQHVGGADDGAGPTFEMAETTRLVATIDGPRTQWTLAGDPVAIDLGGSPA